MGKLKILTLGAVLAMALSVTAFAADSNDRYDRPASNGYGMMGDRGHYYRYMGYNNPNVDRANRYYNEREFNSNIDVNRDVNRDNDSNYKRGNYRDNRQYCGYGDRRDGYDNGRRGYRNSDRGYGPCHD